MERPEIINVSRCPSPEISAYIDGELSTQSELRLERHLSSCSTCSEDLNLQKSFLSALESTLRDKGQIDLPGDFTRTVVANAESRVFGLRHPRERRTSALICGVLIFAAVALWSDSEATVSAASAIVEQAAALVVSIGNLAYHFALGTTIVFRTLASEFVFDSTFAVVFFLVLFILSLYLSSRLLVRFHRT
jgi:anti-sigma factor RsiW